MKYTTTNEWNHFDFSEAYLSEIQKISDCYQFTLDNVKIQPDNSKNRDIRQMRTNGLYFTIQGAQLVRMVEEGYRVLDADGKPMQQYEDQELPADCYPERLKSFADGEGCIYALEKSGHTYIITIDASNERTYVLYITGTGDREEWDRFLNV